MMRRKITFSLPHTFLFNSLQQCVWVMSFAGRKLTQKMYAGCLFELTMHLWLDFLDSICVGNWLHGHKSSSYMKSTIHESMY